MVSKAAARESWISFLPSYRTVDEIPGISEFTELGKFGIRSSYPVVCTSLLNLTEDSIEREFENSFSSEDHCQEFGKPAFYRPRFCNGSRGIAIRFPMNKLNAVLSNLSGRKISIMWPSTMRKHYHNTVRGLNEILNSLENGDTITEKNQKLISKYLGIAKKAILGDKGEISSNQNKSLTAKENTMMSELVNTTCLANLVLKLPLLKFEDRKVAALVFCNVMRRQVHPPLQFVNFLADNTHVLMSIMNGLKQQQTAGVCGSMLRECFRFESLAKKFIESDEFYDLFDLLKATTFEISSDGFLTFRALLTQNKRISADFISKNYKKFFEYFDGLLACDNYVTQISSLRLLTEILLERNNYGVMNKYVADAKNLKRLMILMKSTHKNIQFEAYHAFKIFVVNPEPVYAVRSIFMKNKDRLIEFLSDFQEERDNEEFKDEKTFLAKQLAELQLNPAESSERDGTYHLISKYTED